MAKDTEKEVQEEIVEETTEAANDAIENEEEAESASEEKSADGNPTEEEGKKDKKDQQIEELNDKLMRQMAEFENFRKRSEKEKAAMFNMGAVAVLEKILPVIDNFERGLDQADDSAFAQGMQMIYKQMHTSLEEIGLTEIEALGKTFDPNFHNAVMHEDNEEAGENEITQELQKGYMYHDSVIRHSMVKVAN